MRSVNPIPIRYFRGSGQDIATDAADLTTRDWIMFVDADEEIPSELVEEIRTELNGRAKEFDGYFVYRRTYYLGRWIRYGGWYPDGEIRLYRREKGRWEGGLHAKLVVTGKLF
jgi:glycosyltransferase involved in cell wall biosynthesis